MRAALTSTVRLAALCALGGVMAPGTAGRVLAGVAVGLVVAGPLARVAWLGVDWWQQGDRRFTAAAAALLAVVATGSLLSMLT